MSDLNAVQDLNEQLARKIHEDAQRDPHSPYAHKYVGIANGRDVVTAEDLDEVIRRLKDIEPDLGKCYSIWIDPDTHFGAANEIWRMH